MAYEITHSPPLDTSYATWSDQLYLLEINKPISKCTKLKILGTVSMEIRDIKFCLTELLVDRKVVLHLYSVSGKTFCF